MELAHELACLSLVRDEFGDILRILLVQKSWRRHSSPVISHLLVVHESRILRRLENSWGLAEVACHLPVGAITIKCRVLTKRVGLSDRAGLGLGWILRWHVSHTLIINLDIANLLYTLNPLVLIFNKDPASLTFAFWLTIVCAA